MKKVVCVLEPVLFLLVVVSIILWFGEKQPEPSVIIECDTVYKDTTIYKPVPVDSHKTGKVVYIRVPVPEYLPGDTIHDSIEVPIPIYQKRYEDSLYTAWVSGYRPNLDSIRLYLPEVQTTITKTIVKPSPLITFGIQAGGGYGVINRKPDIYVGVGAQLNLWRK